MSSTSEEGPAVTARVEVQTSMGRLVIALFGDAAPRTVENFLNYVDRGFYTGKIFHRIIPGFMVQGGGYDESMTKGPTELPVQLEIAPGVTHVPGVVSMARTSDPNSATAQFFICVGSPSHLDGQYAAFGRVEEGYSVVEAIEGVPTEAVGGMSDVPSTPVVINSVSRL